MCMMCPDSVDRCLICQRGTRQVYSLDDPTWCEHMIEKHGTDDPGHYAHFAWGDHTGDDCECMTGNWWPGKPPPKLEEEE